MLQFQIPYLHQGYGYRQSLTSIETAMGYRKYLMMLLFGFTACHPATQSYQPRPGSENAVQRDGTVAYLLRIVADKSNVGKISIVSKTETTGRLKSLGDPTPFASRLTIAQLDEASTVLDVSSVEHPLYSMTEYITAQNELNRKQSAVGQKEFLVRLPLRSNARMLQIEEFRDNQSLGKTRIAIK